VIIVQVSFATYVSYELRTPDDGTLYDNFFDTLLCSCYFALYAVMFLCVLLYFFVQNGG
jgi:hypothetical protein